MAQRINPNILKLNISKGTFNNFHSPGKRPYQFLHEDLYLRKLVEGFYFLFNFYTSEIVINRHQNNNLEDINLKFLLLDFNHLHRSNSGKKGPRVQKDHEYFLKLNKFENLFLNSTVSAEAFSGISVDSRPFFFELQLFNLHLGFSSFHSLDRVLWNSFNINKFSSPPRETHWNDFSSYSSTEMNTGLPTGNESFQPFTKELVSHRLSGVGQGCDSNNHRVPGFTRYAVPSVPGPAGRSSRFLNRCHKVLNSRGEFTWGIFKGKSLAGEKKTKILSQTLVLKHLQVSYINFTKLIYIYFISHYLSQFLSNFVNNARITVDARLNYKLEKNINIFGKHISKQLIYNPRKFKALFKQYHD